MRIVRDTPVKEKPAKRIPMYKDSAFKARLKLEFIADHNKKIDRQEAKKSQLLEQPASIDKSNF